MDQFRIFSLFIKIAETKSMRAAGDALGISKSVVSHEIGLLEDTLGARLFNRNSRSVALTEAGVRFLHHARTLLQQWHEAEREITETHSAPKGLLQITAPPVFGALYVAPALVEFQKRYPEIDVNMRCEENFSNLVEQGFDIAIRVAIHADTALVQRQLAPNRLILVASPTYLQRYGRPSTPAELAGHRCLRHDDEWAYWSEWIANLPPDQRPPPLNPAMTLDSSFSLLAAAVAGGGIGLLHTYVVGNAVRDGSLQLLMPDWPLAHGSICVLFPHRRQLPMKTRALIDFLVQHFPGTPVWEEGMTFLSSP
jgi:DNA-binding transcriptional LysR family regulator